MFRILSVLSILVVVAASASYGDDRTARIGAAFEDWLAQHDAQGVIAVRGPDGAEVISYGIAADAPVELASVSKSITGLCAVALVEEGLLRPRDTVSGILGRGPAVTVAELITHGGGLQEDATQALMPGWFEDSWVRAEDVLDAVIAKGGPKAPPGRYVYNNENYALLGLVIEAAAGKSYEAACRRRVLEPAGVLAAPSDKTGAYLPWGGWVMTPEDHVAFQAHWFGTGTPYGGDPLAYPHLEVEGGAVYGAGTFVRLAGEGRAHFWHHGAICLPGRLETSAFAVTWFGAWHVLAAYDACVDWDAMIDLDVTLSGAAFGGG